MMTPIGIICIFFLTHYHQFWDRFYKTFYNLIWRYDIEHKDTQHNDIHLNDIQHNNIQHDTQQIEQNILYTNAGKQLPQVSN
jgi:hypothetical protein